MKRRGAKIWLVVYFELYLMFLGASVVLLGVLALTPRKRFPRRVVAWWIAIFGLGTGVWVVVLFGSSTFDERLGVASVRAPSPGQPVLVFMYGWNGDRSTWGEFPRLIADDPRFDGMGIALVTYRSRDGIEGRPVSSTGADVARLISTKLGSQPIIVAAHSMGGLLVRHIIANGEVWPDLKVVRVVSVGSPFDGAEPARLSRHLGVTPLTLADLTRGSPFLASLNKQWNERQRHGWHGEDACIGGRSDNVVVLASALHGCTKKLPPLDNGHVDIVKPTSRDHAAYKAISSALLGQ